jgi:large subunit ribosomal protein L29
MKEKTTTELSELLVQTEDEQFRLRMQHHTGQLERSSSLRKARRTIARIKTILTERQKAEV